MGGAEQWGGGERPYHARTRVAAAAQRCVWRQARTAHWLCRFDSQTYLRNFGWRTRFPIRIEETEAEEPVQMSLAVSYFVLVVGVAIAALLFRLAIRLHRADRIESRKSAARVRSLKDALLGRALTREDFLPDARVKAGIIYNMRKKRIEVSGRLSSESLDRVFR